MASRAPNHYEVLEVGRDASAEEIHRAYRRLARRYHPDVNPGPDARDRFDEASAAYAVLHDPELRARYDARDMGVQPVARPRAIRRPSFCASPQRLDVPRFLDEAPPPRRVVPAAWLTVRWLS